MKEEGGEIEELTLELDVARIFFAEEEEEEARVIVSLRDVTKRRQAEKELRESEERYRSLVREIVDAVILVDPTGKILLANDMALVTLRKPESRVINHNLNEVLPTGVAKDLLATVKKVVSSKKPTIHVDWLNRRYLESVIAPTLNRNGEVISVSIVGRDLSDRKKSDEVLEMYQSMVKGAEDVIFYKDLQSRYLIANDQTLRAFGLPRKEVIGKNDLEIMPDKQEAQKNIEDDQRVFKSGKTVEFTKQMTSADGKEYWFWAVKIPQFNDRGNIVGLVGFARNITGQKQAEQSLRESEEKYRAIFDNANDAIVCVDKLGSINNINRMATHIFGYQKSEVIGKHFTKLGIVGIKDLPKIVKVFRSAVRGGKHIPLMELAVTDKKGRKLFIEASTRIVKKDGKIAGFLTLIRDVTERKLAEESLRKSENRFRELTDALPEIVFEMDREGNITFANKIAFKVFGYTQSDINKGLNAFQLLAPESRDPGMENIRKIFDGKEVGANEYLAQKKDGTTFPAIIHSKAIVDGEEINGLRGVVLDITEQKQAERASRFKKFAEMLLRVQEEERKRIARELHDEIGQDLTAIKLTIGMIKKDYPHLEGPLRKELQEVGKLVDMAMTNVRRISSRMRPEALDELGLIPCLRHEVESISERSGIKIELELKNFKRRATPQKETIIYRVIQEALTNIIKHSQASQAGVRLSREKKAINLKIWDNGRGFNTENLSNSRGLGILGMGERLVPVDGKLKLESSPGEGTTLEIRIPV